MQHYKVLTLFSPSHFCHEILTGSERKRVQAPQKNISPHFISSNSNLCVDSPPFFLTLVTCVLGLNEDRGALVILANRHLSTQHRSMAKSSCKNEPAVSRVHKVIICKLKLTSRHYQHLYNVFLCFILKTRFGKTMVDCSYCCVIELTNKFRFFIKLQLPIADPEHKHALKKWHQLLLVCKLIFG